MDENQSSEMESTNRFDTYCPFINGVYSFTHTKTIWRDSKVNTEDKTASRRPNKKFEKIEKVSSSACGVTKQNKLKSSISNCPKGHVINITFQKDRCFSEVYEGNTKKTKQLGNNDFKEENMSFNCLGDWSSENNGERYVALLQNSRSFESQPQYRCAVRLSCNIFILIFPHTFGIKLIMINFIVYFIFLFISFWMSF